MPPATDFCPYVGLQPFTEEDRAYFFGRAREIRLVGANLFAAKLTVLYGESGVGKSSLLMAGVLPGLRKKPRTVGVMFRDWQRPDAPSMLKAAVVRAADETAGAPLELDAAAPLDDLLAAAGKAIGGTVLVLLDQFEEYFLYFPLGGTGDEFDAEFARAVNRRDVNAGFVLSIREDSLSKLDRFRARIPTVLANPLRIRHLRPQDAREAINKPLEVYNRRAEAAGQPVTIEPTLVDALIEQTISGRVSLAQAGSATGTPTDAGERVEAPYLQLVLTRLWEEEARARSTLLRAETLKKLGGAARIVRTHLDQVMSTLAANEQALCAQFFDRLVTPSGTKIACRLDDLKQWAGDGRAQDVERVVAALAAPAARILRAIDPLPGQPPQYEIFHDVLAAGVLAWQGRFAEKVRAKRQRARFIVAGVVVLLSLATALVAVWAWMQARDAERESRAREYAADAMLKRGFDPRAATSIAWSASLISSHSSVDSALRHSLASLNERVAVLVPPGRSIVAADVARDARSVALVLDDGTVEGRAIPSLEVLWSHKISGPRVESLIYLEAPGIVLLKGQTRAGVRVTRLDTGSGAATVLKLSQQAIWADPGSTVARRQLDHEIQVATDMATGVDAAIRPCPGAQVIEVARRGGRLLVAQWRATPTDRAIQICDGATGRELAHLPAGERFRAETGQGPIRGVFSDDGRLFATHDIYEEEVHVWDWEQGRSATLRDFTSVPGLPRFGPDLTVVIPVFDGTIELWRLSTLHRDRDKRTQRNERVLRLPGRPGPILAVLTGSDGASVLSVESGALRLWQGIAPPPRVTDLPAKVEAGAFGPGGVPWLVLADGRFGSLASDGRFNVAAPAPDAGGLAGIAASADRSLVLVASKDGLLTVENLAEGRRQRTIRIPEGIVAAHWVSVCCRFAVRTPEGTVKVFEVKNETVLTTLRLPDDVDGGRLAPDLRHWIRRGGTVIDLVADGQRRELKGRVLGGRWPFVGVSGVLTVDGFGVARIEPVAPGAAVIELAGHAAAVRDAAITTDGRIVVTGGDDWHAVRWLAARGERVVRFSGHVGPIREVAIAWWSEFVATLGDDATLRVWDPQSGAQLVRYALAPGSHRLLDFTGARLLVASPERGLIILECEPCRSLPELKAVAEARLLRLRARAKEPTTGASAER